jgi:phosphate transport system protein
MIVEDLAVATATLLGGRRETASVPAGRERLTDALYVEIEDLAARAILLQAPVAFDLRFLLTVLRVVPEMERSHDLVAQIASRASRIDGEDLPPKVAPGRGADGRPRCRHVVAGGGRLARTGPLGRGRTGPPPR